MPGSSAQRTVAEFRGRTARIPADELPEIRRGTASIDAERESSVAAKTGRDRGIGELRRSQARKEHTILDESAAGDFKRWQILFVELWI